MADMGTDGQNEAVLLWNIIELVKDVVRLKGAGIRDGLIPGGLATAEEAVKQGFLELAHRSGRHNYYQLTFSGLILYWEQIDDGEPLPSIRTID